ncbi:hypothetical protein GCM10009715_43410 [Paeniglutamicibacter psychrophenolicus]|uniref:ATP-binding cassette subfamily B protein n=1 Tax=Paeniglutamicibacter psychrophenolicus TaxID=257454 RepID=A0ABS4WIZ1_9MICC|nr:ABC transporter ATP-binding protein [Paeniglutamicibacter psychrophenolicus]MBP2376155.1 ATP-binding cassette subfamily B protein [Paeniglutamicibacter psychrophenolicus]
MSSGFSDPSTGKDPFRISRALIAAVVAAGVLQSVALVFFVVAVHQMLRAVGPDQFGSQAQADWTAGTNAAWLLLASMAGVALGRGASFAFSERAGYEMVRELRMSQYRHLQGMSQRQLQHRSRGGLLLRFTGDLGMLRTWVSRGLLEGSVCVIVVCAGLGTLFWLDPHLGTAVAGSLCLVAAAGLAGGHGMRKSIRSMRRRRSLLTSNIDEQLQAMPVVQGFDRLAGEESRLSRQNDAMTRSLVSVANRRGFWRMLTALCGLLPVAAVLCVGLVQVRNQQMDLAALVSGLVVAQYLARPVRVIGQGHDHWHRSRISDGKIRDFLASSSRRLDDGSPSLLVGAGEIQMRGLAVEGSLKPLTATIAGGQFVAVTGANGSGKSTLLAAIAGLVAPTSGLLLLDGQDTSEVNLRSRLGRCGFVSPDLPLMRGSVLRNITYGRPLSTGAEIHRVVLGSGLDEVLSDLENGIDTWLTEGGRNLSVGQRQRIAWARALMGNPKILLLDEPGSMLDRRARDALHGMLHHHAGTVVLATHDPDELAMADVIWHLERGQLVRVQSGESYHEESWLAQQADPARFAGMGGIR